MKPVPTSIRSRKKYLTKIIRRFVRKDVLVFVCKNAQITNHDQLRKCWKAVIWDRNERPSMGIHICSWDESEFIADVAWAVSYGPKSRWTNEEVEKMMDGVKLPPFIPSDDYLQLERMPVVSREDLVAMHNALQCSDTRIEVMTVEEFKNKYGE